VENSSACGHQESEQQQCRARTRVLLQDRQDSPGDQQQCGEIEKALKRGQDDVGRQHADAVERGDEHQEYTRQKEAYPGHQQPYGGWITAVAIPVPERYSQDELNSEQGHQVVDQVAGWNSDYLNKVSQKRHRL
jgi:hypothetical protein